MKGLDRLGIKRSILLIALLPMVIANLAALQLAAAARDEERAALDDVVALEQLLATHDLQLATATEASLYRGWSAVSGSAALSGQESRSGDSMTPRFQAATDDALARFSSSGTVGASEIVDRLERVIAELRGTPLGQSESSDVVELEAIAAELQVLADSIASGRNAEWETINLQAAFASNLSTESLMIGTLYLAGSSSEAARQVAAVLIDRTDSTYRLLEANLDPDAMERLDEALDSSQYMPDLRRQSLDLPDEFTPLNMLQLARAFNDLARLQDASDEIRAELASGLRDDATARAAAAEAERQLMFGVAALALVLPGALVLVVGGRITRRVQRLAEAARRISNGELGVLVDDVEGRDELGLLAGAFNDVSATVSLGHDQIAALADGRLADPVLDQELPGPVGHTLRVALRRLGNTTAELAHHAQHDRLTGLLDRRGFHLACAEGGSLRSEAVLLIDLDGFKAVNDNYGHAAGDVVLQEVARRLRSATREGDVVARLGGDEFVVLTRDPLVVEGLADRLVQSIAEPIDIDSAEVTVSASVGWTTARPHEAPEDALERADRAMYEAKRAGKDRVVQIPA